MSSLRPLPTAQRRGDWRRRLYFWNAAEGQAHDISGAVLGLAIYRAGGTGPRWSLDYGRLLCSGLADGDWSDCLPVLRSGSQDVGAWIVPDGASHGGLQVPQAVMAQICPGRYRVTVAAAYAQGFIVSVFDEIATIAGPSVQPVLRQITADSGLTIDPNLPVDAPTPTF